VASLTPRLDGTQIRSGRGAEKKSLCSYQESNPGRLGRNSVTILTDLSRLKVVNQLISETDLLPL
jgi:hypothetical protein